MSAADGSGGVAPTGRLRIAPAWLHVPLVLLAFPFTEVLSRGTSAVQYAHDVFDEGSTTRLGIVRADWLTHGLTLWDPHLTAGNSLWTQFAMPPIAADTVLSLLSGPFVAYTATYLLTTLAAGLGMFLFLRGSVRLGVVPALLGSVSYEFSFWQYSLGLPGPLLPVALWLVDRPAGSRWRGALGQLALAGLVVLMLYQGQSQIAVFVGVMQVAWISVTRTPADPWWPRVVRLGTAWLAGLLVYAPVLLGELVLLPTSQRAGWNLSFLFPTGGQAIADVVHLYSDVVLGLPRGVWGNSPDQYGTFFIGAVGLPLLVIALVMFPRPARLRMLIALLVAVPVADLLLSLVQPHLGDVGLLRSFQLVRVRHLYPFALCAAAAIGADQLTAHPERSARRRRIALIVAAVVGAAAAIWMASGTGAFLSADEAARRAAGQLAVVAAALAAIVAVSMATVALLRRPLGRSVMLALLLVAVVDRAAYARVERGAEAVPGPASPLASWEDRLGDTPAIRFLRSVEAPGDRVLVLMDRASGPEGSILLSDHPNRFAFAGLDVVGGYQNVYPREMQLLYGQLIAPNLVQAPRLTRYFYEWGSRAYTFGSRFNAPVADLLGARWIYGPGVVAGTGLVLRYSDGASSVWENSEAFPRAFVARQVATFPTQSEVFSAIGRASRDELLGTAFVPAGAIPGLVGGGARGGTSSVTVEQDAIDSVSLAVTAAQPGILVLRDAASPGWEAVANGVPTPVITVDGALRGVLVPGGRSEVVFRYRPWFIQAGLELAVLGLMLAVLSAITVEVLARRRRALAAASFTP